MGNLSRRFQDGGSSDVRGEAAGLAVGQVQAVRRSGRGVSLPGDRGDTALGGLADVLVPGGEVSVGKQDAPVFTKRGRGGRPRLEDRDKTIEATKPWLSAGMSRRTWFDRKAGVEKRAVADYAGDRALDVGAALAAWRNESEEVRERYRRMAREVVE